MEYTAQIDALTQHMMTVQVEETKTQSIKNIMSLPTGIYLLQAVCYLLQMKAATISGLGSAVSMLAIFTSAAGIVDGILIAHRKSTLSGLNCAVVNFGGLLFWTVQFLFRSIAL